MNFNELMRKMVELDQPTTERATGGRPGINALTGQPAAPAAPGPDHLAEPPERAPMAPGAPNILANKTRMPDPAAAARAQRGAMANDLANQEQPKEGNAFSGALDAARDSGQSEFEVDGQTFKVKEDDVDECGMPGMANMPGGMMGMRNGTPPQADSISANVSMNAQGAGGIKNLMDILKNIEDGNTSSDSNDMEDPAILIKKMQHPFMGGDDKGPGQKIIGQEELANSPDEMYADTGAVTGTGDDLHGNASRGNQGDRYDGYAPRGVTAMEGLVQRLSNLYNEVKSR